MSRGFLGSRWYYEGGELVQDHRRQTQNSTTATGRPAQAGGRRQNGETR